MKVDFIECIVYDFQGGFKSLIFWLTWEAKQQFSSFANNNS